MPKGFSLHIGLNSIDPQHYGGWDGKLTSCESDAEDMELIAKSLHYENISTLLTAKATIENVVVEIKKAAASLENGDIFFLSYSGHGSNIPDKEKEEDDGQDETWCLYDGQLLDDELYSLWHLFKEDVRIIVLSDSCQSGTVVRAYHYGLNNSSNHNSSTGTTYKFLPPDINHKTFEKNRSFYTEKQIKYKEDYSEELKCSIKLISGCQDNQYSADGDSNGLFTSTLLKVWKNGTFEGNYKLFHKKILELMPPNQSPNYMCIGKSNEKFDNQKPFTI